MCVYMNDGPYVWVFAFIKSALCFFKKDFGDNVSHWWKKVASLSCCPFHDLKWKVFRGGRRNDFLAVEEMNWMIENWLGWLNSSLFIL